MEILIRSNGNPTLIYVARIYPLRILKQIVTMIFSINSPAFRNAHKYLANFILNKEKKYLPPEYRVYAYYNIQNSFKSVGVAVSVDILSGEINAISEFNYPPYGYVITLDSKQPDNRLFDITHFAEYNYSSYREMPMNLRTLESHTIYPADYRNKKKLMQDRLISLLEHKENSDIELQ